MAHTPLTSPRFRLHLYPAALQELDGLLKGLGGRYVLPEAGGDLLRDGSGVLPTGERPLVLKRTRKHAGNTGGVVVQSVQMCERVNHIEWFL